MAVGMPSAGNPQAMSGTFVGFTLAATLSLIVVDLFLSGHVPCRDRRAVLHASSSIPLHRSVIVVLPLDLASLYRPISAADRADPGAVSGLTATGGSACGRSGLAIVGMVPAISGRISRVTALQHCDYARDRASVTVTRPCATSSRRPCWKRARARWSRSAPTSCWREARLSSLESSIHPHFLFNTLNSIAALIPSDPHRAEDTGGQSGIAAALLAERAAQRPGSSCAGVESSARLSGNRRRRALARGCVTRFVVPDSLDSSTFPPCRCRPWWRIPSSTWPRPRMEGASIQILGRANGDRIWLEVSDDGPGFTSSQIEAEHGLGNLVARLELLLGSEARLEIGREQERRSSASRFRWIVRSHEDRTAARLSGG